MSVNGFNYSTNNINKASLSPCETNLLNEVIEKQPKKGKKTRRNQSRLWINPGPLFRLLYIAIYRDKTCWEVGRDPAFPVPS